MGGPRRRLKQRRNRVEVRGVGCHVTRSGREQGWGRAGRLWLLSWIPDRSGELGALGLSLSGGESSGRDMAGLAGRGEPSCLSLSLTVQSREGDWSLQACRRCSWGGAGEAVHLFRPVGPGCPRTGFWHFLQVLSLGVP